MSYHAILPRQQAMSGVALGTLMRTNPLPPGRYWIDVFGDNRVKMDTWFKQNSAAARSEVANSFDATGDFPARDFYIFNVLSPVPWDAKTFGYPTVADKTVQSSDDTVTRPPLPKDGMTLLSDFFDSLMHGAAAAGNTAQSIGFWVAVAVGGVLVLKTVEVTGIFKRAKS